MQIDWSAVQGISAGLGTLVVILAAAYAYMQVREAQLARTYTLLWDFYSHYNEPALRDFQHRLLMEQSVDVEKLEPPDRDLLSRILGLLEYLSILVERGLIRPELATEFFEFTPPRIRLAAEPFIADYRRHNSKYAAHLDRFVEHYPPMPAVATLPKKFVSPPSAAAGP